MLSLVLKAVNQVENTVVCMARLLSSNERISHNSDTIHLKLPIAQCSFAPHGQNIKALKIDFYDASLRHSIGKLTLQRAGGHAPNPLWRQNRQLSYILGVSEVFEYRSVRMETVV